MSKKLNTSLGGLGFFTEKAGSESGNSHCALSCTLGWWKCKDRAWGGRKLWARSSCVASLCFATLQVVLLCWENRLYDAMIYVYNSGMNDFISPMEVGEVLLQEVFSTHSSWETAFQTQSLILFSVFCSLAHFHFRGKNHCVLCTVYLTGCSRGEK